MILAMKKDPVLTGKICPYCGKPTKLIDSVEIYGISYGWLYICKDCDAYVGCHKGTKKSLGRVANSTLRTLKHNAHEVFDLIWKDNHNGRKSAYKWLSKELNLSRDITHIGMLNEEQCKRVIELSKDYLLQKDKEKYETHFSNIKFINDN